MKYKKYLEKIMAALNEYKEAVDGIVVRCKAEEKKNSEFLAAMKGKYTNEYIQEKQKEWNESRNYAQSIEKEREGRKKVATFYLDLMKEQIDEYFQAPVKSEFANKIMAIKATGLQLSDMEFSLLQQQATSYMERRLLNELAENRDTQGNFDMRTKVELPDIEGVYQAYNDMKNNVNVGFDWYCGDNMELKKYIGYDPEDYVQAGNISHAINCFKANNRSYTVFDTVMDKANAILPKNKTKMALSARDVDLINAILPDYEKYPDSTKRQAVEIAKSSPEIAALLMLDNRYSEAVNDAIETD